MEAFLYHILKALIIDEYRRHKSTSLDVLIEQGFEPSLDDTQRFVDMLDGKQAIALIAQLPLRYKKVMYMKYVQDLTVKEISLITNQTKNTVAVQTHRGLEKLQVLYALHFEQKDMRQITKIQVL
jgi:RNA polymerase sigma-70 factor (ECF subfamily)